MKAALMSLLAALALVLGGVRAAQEPGAQPDARDDTEQQHRILARFDLRLMPSLNDVSGIPTEGKDLIVVAAVNNVLHFRIFDGEGDRVVDADENGLMDQVRQIEDLRRQLESLWPPHELTKSDKDRVIAAVASIVKHTILARVMAKKLRYAHQLMTSLVTEDFARMAIDAGELKRLSDTTLMKISPKEEYVKYAVEFSSVVEELGRRAQAHDLNGATLSYTHLTMNCVECHKYVRDKSIFGRNR